MESSTNNTTTHPSPRGYMSHFVSLLWDPSIQHAPCTCTRWKSGTSRLAHASIPQSVRLSGGKWCIFEIIFPRLEAWMKGLWHIFVLVGIKMNENQWTFVSYYEWMDSFDDAWIGWQLLSSQIRESVIIYKSICLKYVISAPCSQASIGVITPYRAQCDRILQLLAKKKAMHGR